MPSMTDPTARSSIRSRSFLDTRVRPAVAQDGGDITFHGFERGVVLPAHAGGGPCAGCPSSTLTLKDGHREPPAPLHSRSGRSSGRSPSERIATDDSRLRYLRSPRRRLSLAIPAACPLRRHVERAGRTAHADLRGNSSMRPGSRLATSMRLPSAWDRAISPACASGSSAARGMALALGVPAIGVHPGSRRWPMAGRGPDR